MNILQTVVTVVASLLLLGGMLALARRSTPPETDAGGRTTFRVHPIWFWFCGIGGAFVAGLFAAIAITADAGQRTGPAWAAIIAAAFIVFTLAVLRSLRVDIDAENITVHTLFNSRTVALANVDSFKIVGLALEIRIAPAPGEKRSRPITVLAALRGMRRLLELLGPHAARRGEPMASP